MTGDVKIQVGMSGGDHQPDPFDIKVFLNGHELQGLCALQVNIEAQELPTVTFTIEPATLEFEGLAELKRVSAEAWEPEEREDEERVPDDQETAG